LQVDLILDCYDDKDLRIAVKAVAATVSNLRNGLGFPIGPQLLPAL